ncbi:MAG: hemerythrin family protein [Treponema sp.]|nr:hemerythrin family protein [Treponema sp.]
MVVNISAKDGFIWDDSYLLGNEPVDTQHHQLFDLINSLVNFCDNGFEKEKIKTTLDFLVNYTIDHFNDEEALQIKCKYPEYEAHKKIHEDFKVTVGDLVDRFNKNGSSSALSSDIKSVVIKWLVNHILYEDKKIGVHLQNCVDN